MINTNFRTIKFLENERENIQNLELCKEILDLTRKAWSINEKKVIIWTSSKLELLLYKKKKPLYDLVMTR